MRKEKATIDEIGKKISGLNDRIKDLTDRQKSLISSYLKDFLKDCRNGRFDFSEITDREGPLYDWRVYHDVYDRRGECSYSGHIRAIRILDGQTEIEVEDNYGYGIMNKVHFAWLDQETADSLYRFIAMTREAAGQGEVIMEDMDGFTAARYPEED